MPEQVNVIRVIPENLRAGYDRVDNLSKEESVRVWATLTGRTIEILRHKAQLIWHFNEKGWNIHELGNGHSHFYMLIANGQMLPELLATIADPALIERAAKLTLPDQERVVKNDEVKVLLGFKDDGQPISALMNLQKLAPKLARSVFHGDKINEYQDQLIHARQQSKSAGREPRIGVLRADRRRRGATSKIGNVEVFYDLEQLEGVIGAIRD